MCARFKDPFKKSSINFGMRMLDRLIFRPTIKLGSAVIKDLTSPRNSTYSKTPSYYTQSPKTSQIKRSDNHYSYPTANHSERPSIYSPDAQDRLNKRKTGLEQCKAVTALIGKFTIDQSIDSSTRSAISKIHVAINKYLDKGVLCGMDFYSFADSFCSDQIANLKTDKSKWEYGIARKILLVIQSGYSYEMIVQYLKTIN